MLLSHQNLYYKLKEMDLSYFKIDNSDKMEVPSNVKKNMRYVGTEFERVFTSILGQKYGLIAKSLEIKIKKQIINKNTKIEIYQALNLEKTNNFNLRNYMEGYKCFSNSDLCFHEKAEMEIFIRDILLKVNFNKFKPRKHILTKIKFQTKLENINVGGLYGEIDLIIDDKIIDIKTDTILKLNNNYLVQLLYYYFLLNYSIKYNRYSSCFLNKLKINKICLYYACFDVLIEFDVKKIFKDKNLIHEIENLIHDNFINYNFNLKEVIHFVVFKSKINENYFDEINSNINENQFSLYNSYIDSAFKFDFKMNNKFDYNREFLLQFLKINISLLEQRKSNSISIEKYDLILKHLIFTFRKANRVQINKVLKLNDKHMFMSLRIYFEMNKNIKILSNYKEKLNKKEITKSIYEIYSNYYYDNWIYFEEENAYKFECFLNNINSIYLEFYKQKASKFITKKEFDLLIEFILELVEYGIKKNKSKVSDTLILSFKTIKSLKKYFQKSIISKKSLDIAIHKLFNVSSTHEIKTNNI